MKNGEWIKWGIGILITFLTIILPFIGNAVIKNEEKSIARDVKIEDCFKTTVSEQNKVNQQILVSLEKINGKFETIQLDLSYIKKNVKNGR